MQGDVHRRWATTVVVAHPGAELYGADRMVLESVVGLLEHGARVIVVVPIGGPLVARLRQAGAAVLIRPVPVLRKGALGARGLITLASRAVRALPGMVRLLRSSRADVLYVSTVTLPLWLVAARLSRTPAVVHVHEAEHSIPGWMQRGLAAPLLLARRVLVNSRFTKRVLTDSLPRTGAAALVVDNGIPGPPEIVPARPELDGPLNVLYLGRLSPRKGPHVAVHAVSLAREKGVDVRLDLLGDVFAGYEWYRDQLEATIDRLDLRGSVRVHGFRTCVRETLERCDALVVPSTHDESFGNTAVEGLLAARPVVVSRTSGLLGAAEGYGAAVWVSPDDPEDLARGIIELRDRWSDLRRSALHDAARAAHKHSPARYRSRVAELTTGAA